MITPVKNKQSAIITMQKQYIQSICNLQPTDDILNTLVLGLTTYTTKHGNTPIPTIDIRLEKECAQLIGWLSRVNELKYDAYRNHVIEHFKRLYLNRHF